MKAASDGRSTRIITRELAQSRAMAIHRPWATPRAFDAFMGRIVTVEPAGSKRGRRCLSGLEPHQ
jgi:hypothetical protein